MIAAWIVLAAAGAAAYTDVTRRRIPNALVLAVLLIGLALHGAAGLQSFLASLAIFAAVIAVGTIGFSMRIIGGGDVKFIAAAAATLGWPDTLPFLAWTLVAGGLLAVAVSIARRRFAQTMSNVGALSFALLSGARPQITPSASGSIPYAVAIFAGATVVVLANIFALHLRIPL